MRGIDAVVFDLGGVLIDWDPRYLYRSLFGGDDRAMEAFLRDVCSPEWIASIDAGKPFADAVRELAEARPEHRDLIEAFHARWPETLGDPIDGSVRLVEELCGSDVGLFALSDWSSETFPIAEQRFPFLRLFDGILISGEAGASKPAPAIFVAFLDRFGLEAGGCVFVDDHDANVTAAARLGFDAILFVSPERLRDELRRRRLLD